MKTVCIDRIKLITEIARADMKVYEVAKAASVSRATVISIKAGKSCTEETAEKLAAALGCPLAALLGE